MANVFNCNYVTCVECHREIKGVFSYDAREKCADCGGEAIMCSKKQLAERIPAGKLYRQKILKEKQL